MLLRDAESSFFLFFSSGGAGRAAGACGVWTLGCGGGTFTGGGWRRSFGSSCFCCGAIRGAASFLGAIWGVGSFFGVEGRSILGASVRGPGDVPLPFSSGPVLAPFL